MRLYIPINQDNETVVFVEKTKHKSTKTSMLCTKIQETHKIMCSWVLRIKWKGYRSFGLTVAVSNNYNTLHTR